MSPFCRSLLSMSAGGSVMGLLLLLLRRWSRHRSPSRIFYAAWLLVALRLLLPVPAAQIVSPRSADRGDAGIAWREEVEEIRHVPVFDFAPSTAGNAQPVSVPDTAAAEPSNAVSAAGRSTFRLTQDSALILLWCLGVLGLLSWYVIGYSRFIRPVRRSLKPPSQQLLEAYIALEGTDKADLAQSRLAPGPMQLGFLHPVIVLPDREYAPETLKSILRHELVHFRRRDVIWKWLGVLAHCVHWFNPLMILFLRETDSVCELSCDETLLRSMKEEEKRRYGEMLLQMAAEGALPRRDIINPLAGEKKDLKDRLSQILKMSKRRKIGTLAGLAGMIILCGCAAVMGPAATKETPPMKVPPGDFTVSSVDELLSAIAPDRTVVLDPGKYELYTASDYGTSYPDGYYTWEPVFDGYALVLRNLSGFKIQGPGREDALICTTPRYADVISFSFCRDSEISGVTIGHTEQPGFCRGGVVGVDASEDIRIRDCELFGCGILGLNAVSSEQVYVENSHILDCSQGAARAERCRDIRVTDCVIEQCGNEVVPGTVFLSWYCSGFAVVNSEIRECVGNYLFEGMSSPELYFLGNRVESNHFWAAAFSSMVDPDPIVIDHCVFSDNLGELIRTPGSPQEIRPVDGKGNALTGSALESMRHQKTDYAGPADVPIPETHFASDGNASRTDYSAAASNGFIYEEVMVYTVDELLDALEKNYAIIALGAEEYDLTTATGYGEVNGKNYRWEPTLHGASLVISGVPSLHIASTLGNGSRILSGGHEDVLTFENIWSLSLTRLHFAHVPDVFSDPLGAGVVLRNCQPASLNECEFSGGRTGLSVRNSADVWVMNSRFSDLNEGAAEIKGSHDVYFSLCTEQNCGEDPLRISKSEMIVWEDEDIRA